MVRKTSRATIATIIPAAVVIRASPIPAAAFDASAVVPPPPILRLLNVTMRPVTVPSSPKNGATATIVSNSFSPFRICTNSLSPAASIARRKVSGVGCRSFSGA